MTTTEIVSRRVVRVDSPDIGQGMTPDHRVRQLVPPVDFAASDPFLLLMEDWFPLGVFDRHPHRGIETVTFVLDGSIEHYDNHGNSGKIGSGDALWLTAGRGLIHNEMPGAGETSHILQLWVNLPKADKLVPAGFQELRSADAVTRSEPGALVRVFSGRSGDVQSKTKNHVPVTMLEIVLQPNAGVVQALPGDYNGFVVVLEGTVAIGDKHASAGQVAWLEHMTGESSVQITGDASGGRVILFAGQPLREPIAARGPFVMNTDEELAEGFAQYRRQGERFGLDD